MNMLNSLILEGVITEKGAEKIPNGLSFDIVSKRFWKEGDKEKEENSFFTVEVYGKLADFSEKRLVKEQGIRLVGRLASKSWKDEEGKEYSRVYIVAEHIEFKPNLKKK